MAEEWISPQEAAQMHDLSRSDFVKYVKACRAKGIRIQSKKQGWFRRRVVYNRTDLLNAKARLGN